MATVPVRLMACLILAELINTKINTNWELDITKIDNIEFDGIDHKDYPEYSDAYIVYADYDGKPMTEEQIESLSSDFVYEKLIEYLN